MPVRGWLLLQTLIGCSLQVEQRIGFRMSAVCGQHTVEKVRSDPIIEELRPWDDDSVGPIGAVLSPYRPTADAGFFEKQIIESH